MALTLDQGCLALLQKISDPYEAKLNRQTLRRTIGAVRSWTIDAARTEACRIAVMP